MPETKRFIPKGFELGTTLSQPNRSITYGYLPEKRSFHTFNLCLIVPHLYIYTTAKESEPCSFLAFKAFLKYKLPIEPSSVRESLSLQLQTSLTCLVISVIWLLFNFTYLFHFLFVINNCSILYSSCKLSVPFILVLYRRSFFVNIVYCIVLINKL